MQCKYRAHGPYSREGICFCGYMALIPDSECIPGVQWFSLATSEIFGISVIWVDLWEVKHQPQLDTCPDLTAVKFDFGFLSRAWKTWTWLDFENSDQLGAASSATRMQCIFAVSVSDSML